MGRCSWFGDVQSVPVLGLLVCGITPNAGILFSSADLGHLEGATWGFLPSPQPQEPTSKGCPVAGSFARHFLCFFWIFFELSFGIFPRLAHFT